MNIYFVDDIILILGVGQYKKWFKGLKSWFHVYATQKMKLKMHWIALFSKIQDGGQACDMIHLTFFLWEIKSYFSSKWWARYFDSIRRFRPFSAGFKHFLQYFHSYGTHSQFVGTYHIFWDTGFYIYWCTISKVGVYHIMHGNWPNTKYILRFYSHILNELEDFSASYPYYFM